MKMIDISTEQIVDAELISAPNTPYQLYQLGSISFAICIPCTRTIVAGFCSTTLTRYLRSHESLQIVDIELTEQKVIIGLESAGMCLLRLKLRGGTHVLLDEQDHIYEASPYVSEMDRGTLISPCKMWNLPAEGFCARMLLTERMIYHIDDLAKEGQQAHLLNILWKEYQLNKEPNNPEKRYSIEGEFVAFSAKLFAHGLVVFDYA